MREFEAKIGNEEKYAKVLLRMASLGTQSRPTATEAIRLLLD